MVATVSTSPLFDTATAYPNQKKIDNTQDGTQWCMYTDYNTNSAPYAFARSQDQGSSWTAAGAVTNGSSNWSNYTPNMSFWITKNDVAHLAFKDNGNGWLYYKRGTLGGNGFYSWSAATAVETSNTFYNYPDITAFADPANANATVVFIVYALDGSSDSKAFLKQLSVSPAGTVSVSTRVTVGSAPVPTSRPGYPSIAYAHIGDGKTPTSSPDLFVCWQAGVTGVGGGLRMRKGTFGSGTWTWGTERDIDTNALLDTAEWITAFVEGGRFVMAGKVSGANDRLVVHERDLADTTTTLRDLAVNPASTQQLNYGSATPDHSGNVYLHGTDGSAKVNYRRWLRETNTLQAPVTIDASQSRAAAYVTARRFASGNGVDCIYTLNASSPYTVKGNRTTLNQAPTAATPTTPATGSSVDRTQPITLAWVFSDPDAGDSQSKSDIRYKLTSASTWTTILGATTTATSYALPASQTAGDYEWQVLTYDAQGVASPWSASSFFTAANPPGTPVITAPANGGTVATASYAVAWSSPTQDAYEVRRVADNAGSPVPGTLYATTGTVEDSTSRARTLAFETNNRTEHVQVRVRYSGIWSQWATARVLVSYTPPATPVVVLTAQDATASILVSITNPTPSGSQPTVASHDILIDDGFGEGFTRRVTGWAPGTPYTYWLPVSSRDYAGNIQVVAVATNSTTSTGVAT